MARAVARLGSNPKSYPKARTRSSARARSLNADAGVAAHAFIERPLDVTVAPRLAISLPSNLTHVAAAQRPPQRSAAHIN